MPILRSTCRQMLHYDCTMSPSLAQPA